VLAVVSSPRSPHAAIDANCRARNWLASRGPAITRLVETKDNRRAVRSFNLQASSPATVTTHDSWIKSHPVATGALIGLGAGFLIGAISNDPTREENRGPVIWPFLRAGIGALTGGAIGP
jgi:hypothetical protein